MINLETIIGVEVHTELNTIRKIFSPALNDVNAKPNTNVHPIDLGLPGALPSFNEEVLLKALKVTKALNMTITKEMYWDRKNYFYHDNPKGYQITQFHTPIGRKGNITLDNGKDIIVDFMHMEEDTAKTFSENGKISLDYNRSGVPLLEIVTTPCLRNSSETKEYLEKLKEILVFLDVSDGKMEEGSFRVDVNVSVRPVGDTNLYNKVEIKNLNSFNNIIKAIDLEVFDQTKKFITGEPIQISTKRFDEATKTLVIMRTKESINDYRYFPEPDLPYIKLNDSYIAEALRDMPLLPKDIKNRLVNECNLEIKEVQILMGDIAMTNFMLNTLNYEQLDPKQTLNYLLVNVNEYLNKEKIKFKDVNLTVENLIDIAELLKSKKISTNHVKTIIPELLKNKSDVKQIVKELGIEQITDAATIKEFVLEVMDENPESIELFKNGKNKAFGFLIGKIMTKSKGQANPQIVNEILTDELNKIK